VGRYQAICPGAWLLQCHFQMHLDNSLAMATLDRLDKSPELPEEYTMGSNGFRVEEKSELPSAFPSCSLIGSSGRCLHGCWWPQL
jgi:hypothetical protein